MKKTVFFLLAFICASAVFGQTEKPKQQKVAVYVAGGEEDGLGEFAGAYLVDALTHNSNYSAVERTADFLTVLNKEHEYQRTGNVDDEQIAKLGKQFGVKLVCAVKIGQIDDRRFIQARFLEVETANVKNSTKPFIFTLDDLEDVCTKVAVQLLTQSKGSRSIQGAFGQ